MSARWQLVGRGVTTGTGISDLDTSGDGVYWNYFLIAGIQMTKLIS